MGGSCWAFSTTGALEGAWQIATGRLRALSEQQLIDCSTANNACGGGSMDVAFRYLRDNEACTVESYAYEARSGMCRQADTGICAIGIPRGAVLGYRDVAMNDEKSLIAAVAQGPVSVGVDADTTFQLYSGGVLEKRAAPILTTVCLSSDMAPMVAWTSGKSKIRGGQDGALEASSSSSVACPDRGNVA